MHIYFQPKRAKRTTLGPITTSVSNAFFVLVEVPSTSPLPCFQCDCHPWDIANERLVPHGASMLPIVYPNRRHLTSGTTFYFF